MCLGGFSLCLCCRFHPCCEKRRIVVGLCHEKCRSPLRVRLLLVLSKNPLNFESWGKFQGQGKQKDERVHAMHHVTN